MSLSDNDDNESYYDEDNIEDEEISEKENDQDNDQEEENIDNENSDEDDLLEDDEIYEKKKKKKIYNKNRISRPILTIYEKTRLLSIRIKQLNDGAEPLVDTSDCKNTIEIAEKELYLKKMPLSIERPLVNNQYEIFDLSELIII